MKIEGYYRDYLILHQNKNCRRLHVVGNIITLFFIVGCVYSHAWIFLLGAPLIVYPFAWVGHLFFEKNKPAAWQNPIKAKICDWLMMRDIFIGKIKW